MGDYAVVGMYNDQALMAVHSQLYYDKFTLFAMRN